MDELNMMDILDMLKQIAPGLDKICISEHESINPDIPEKKKSISTWMNIYKNAKTVEERECLRQVAINITAKFSDNNTVSKHGTFMAKFESSSPYNFFLTTVARLEETFKQPYSLSFHEIIDHTGGEIVDSLHINYMLDLLWLSTEYMLAAQYPKMTVIYGLLTDPAYESQIPFDITTVKIEMPEFGCHHSKISIFKYKNDSIRIVISTANLYRPDWGQWTQGLWVSPILPCLPEAAANSDGESVTHFKKDFMMYLDVYQQPECSEWKSMIHRIDFSAVKVVFFASVPGYHDASTANLWGYKRLYNIMKEYASLPDNAKDWPIVAQTASVGIYGQHYHSWMSSHIVHAMAKEKDKKIIHFPEFRFLYPTEESFENSFDNETGLTALRYYKDQHFKQQWIENNLYEWKNEKTGRSKAMPHCKSYTRISPDETEIAWFVLTSANLSKAAWGKMMKYETSHFVASYEAGVVFFPQIMINQMTFPIKESADSRAPVFLLPYDVPLSPYKSGMKVSLLQGHPIENDIKERERQSKVKELKEELTKKLLNKETTPQQIYNDIIAAKK